MKTVYFAQHGISEPKDINKERPLSDLGRDDVHKVATYLKNHDIDIGKICHSGKLRALQTATMFSDVLNIDDISELSGMKPNDHPDELIEQITENAVLYVGHLPNIQNVVSNIINKDSRNPVLKFQNSAVACIEINNGAGILKWFITPEMC